MTTYPPGPQQFNQGPGFPASAGNPRPPKTATRVGKTLTFIGIALVIVTAALIVWGTTTVVSLSRETEGSQRADQSNGFIATNLRANTTYLLVPSTYDYGYASDEPSGWSTSSRSIVRRDQLTVTGPDGSDIAVEQPEFNFSGSFFEGVFNTAVADAGSFTTAGAGNYQISILVPVSEDIFFSVVDQGMFDRIVDRISTAIVIFLVAMVTGFFAFVFLVWGIILWAVRAGRARQQRNLATARPRPSGYYDGPPPGYNVGPPPGSAQSPPPGGNQAPSGGYDEGPPAAGNQGPPPPTWQ